MGQSLRHSFGTKLREAREVAALSQAALGRDAGISASEVSRLESGAREPRLTTIIRLARALDLDGSELLRDVG